MEEVTIREDNGKLIYTESYDDMSSALDGFTSKIDALGSTHPGITIKGHIEEVKDKQVLTVITNV